ncbi:glycosyltransferase family A protein [uncultured Ferrovibrio sp.]|jgi:glycosyltransferase involved in cell wall biosynthesis|uniref:glycosyltransferase family 2 protein n=1 Tax=uncultured Ferrovibrio sp. TaxID=1576913 RepID=UPI00261BCAFE|nr:glycosyltransferase family A protein [uncultured Ferrovibrio sp.]
MSAPVAFQHAAMPGLLSIVVPVGKDAEGLRRTLASLKAARQQIPVQIVVGNDGADPDASAIAAAYDVEEAAVMPNGGSYMARNCALVLTKGEWIGFVDADAMVEPGWIEAGIAALREADYVCGPVVIPRHTVETPGHVFDWLNAFPVEGHFRHARFGPTANLFVRRAVIEHVGGFDPRLRSGGDVEFGGRVHAAGFRQRYSPEQMVYHLPRSYREQLTKILRVTKGQCDLGRYYPDRFPELRVSLEGVLRNLMPPRELHFLTHTIEEFGPRAVRLKPLLYLMAWSFKLQRARAQLKYMLSDAGRHEVAVMRRPAPRASDRRTAA